MAKQNELEQALDALNEVNGSENPLIDIEELAIPIGVLSSDDGLIVCANNAFRQAVDKHQIGQYLAELIEIPESRHEVSKCVAQKDKYVATIDTSQSSLRLTITQGLYLGLHRYFVCIEEIDSTSLWQEKSYLDRDRFILHLSQIAIEENFDDTINCLCNINVDRFRVINEKYGFDAGDFVLRELVSVIKKHIPPESVVGRLGDNEFGLILNVTNIDDAVQSCEVIREIVKAAGFEWKSESINLTLSIGVVAMQGDQEDVGDLLGAANLALNSAQENGRDCVHSSATQDTMMAYHSGKMRYALVIEDALQNNKFELFAQPIVSLEDMDKHYSYEVLLRIYDANKKEFVSSQELITAAESLEVTTRIDQWVCEKVFKELSEKVKQNIRIPNLSINLSGHSIVNPVFEKFLLGLTEKYNVPTSCICFEITESVAVKSISRAQKFIRELKAVGFKFSLDDFGVGYCSFNYLQQLDVDNVKIDGSFVSAMLDDATQFATVQAITNVARTMKIKTIAEFVEKPEIIKALKVIGVDYGQGYIFGRPAAMKDIF